MADSSAPRTSSSRVSSPLRIECGGLLPGRGQIGHEPGSLRLECRDDVYVGGCIEGRSQGALALPEHASRATGAFDQPLHAAEGTRQVLVPARRQLRRGRRGCVVEGRQRPLQSGFLA